MCDRCAELNRKIVGCERIIASINDRLAIDPLKGLVEQMKVKKLRFTRSRKHNAKPWQELASKR